MSKTAPIPFKPLDFDNAGAAAEKFSEARNIPSLAFPQDAGAGGEGSGQRPTSVDTGRKRAEPMEGKTLQRVPVVLPDYVVADIKQRALNAKTSNRFIIMQALRKGGIFIAEEDMIEDGRRAR